MVLFKRLMTKDKGLKSKDKSQKVTENLQIKITHS